MEKTEKHIKFFVDKIMNFRNEYFFRITCSELNSPICLIALDKNGRIKKYDEVHYHNIRNSFKEFAPDGNTPFRYEYKVIFSDQYSMKGRVSTANKKIVWTEYCDLVLPITDPKEILFIYSKISNL